MPGRSLALALAVSAGACGFTLTPGGDDAIPEGRRVVVTDDTAAQFADNGGIVDGVVAARGALEPDAFVVGGLKGQAFNSNQVNATRTYEDVVAALGTQLGFAYRQVPRDLNGSNPNRPRGMGLTGNPFTILYTGEVLLPQGTVTLVTDADDDMLLQVSLAPGTWTPKLYTARSEATIDIVVPAAGWYPIRAAYGQNGGGAHWRLQYTVLGSGRTHIDGTRLRARVTEDHGLIANAFQARAMLTPAGETAVATVDEDYGNGPPAHDLPLAAFDDYTVRFAGQVRIDTPGSYTFSAETGDGGDQFRIWIDGVQVANVWSPVPDRLTATLDLAPGWHDLLVDYAEYQLSARIVVRMSGPGIPDGVIDPGRLRPAVAFGLTTQFFDNASYPINDATDAASGVTVIQMPLAAPPGATIGSMDYGLGIANQRLSDLTVDLLDCNGAKTMPAITTPAFYYYYASDTSCANSPVRPATAWAWRLTDTVIGNDPTASPPTVVAPVLVATYSGGDRVPFAPAYTFVSSPKSTPGSIGFGTIDVTADLRGTLLMIEVRSAADPAALEAAPWVPVANGAVPAVAGSEWAQYRLAVSGDGWKLASIDRVDLTYVVQDE